MEKHVNNQEVAEEESKVIDVIPEFGNCGSNGINDDTSTLTSIKDQK
jgi:hypothetical protein